jgi:hypothetical protein
MTREISFGTRMLHWLTSISGSFSQGQGTQNGGGGSKEEKKVLQGND